MNTAESSARSPLLSPPSSPRMSTYTESPHRAAWEDQRHKTAHPPASLPAFSSFPPIPDDTDHPNLLLDNKPPLLRSHKSFPHALTTSFGTSFRKNPLEQVIEKDHFNESGDAPSEGRLAGDGKNSGSGLSLQTRSVPSSPHNQLTPTSPDGQHEEAEDDNAGIVDMDEEEDSGEARGSPRTTAEQRRAEKRKMKRFRLTHTQTRYLMNEFARQAHPDAAHRDRLSREIPGLSPRQVQVWFQNRRAKLKRLTLDDRERMLKSRALPDDFDMSHTLHSPHGGQPGMGGTPVASPISYIPPYSDAQFARPLMLNGLRRPSEDDSVASPLSMSSMYGNFYTPPQSDNVSPISTASERGHFPLPGSQHTSPRASNPFTSRSSSFSTYHHPHIPRLQLQDRIGRARAESLQSPLRSSMSYTGNALGYGETGAMSGPNSSGAGNLPEERQNTRESPSSQPYGIGHNTNLLGSFQQSALSRSRPHGVPAPIPPGLQLRSDNARNRPSVPAISTPQPRTPSYSMQTAPLAPPPEYHHFPQLSASYNSTGFNGAYSHHSTPNTGPPSVASPTPLGGPSTPSYSNSNGTVSSHQHSSGQPAEAPKPEFSQQSSAATPGHGNVQLHLPQPEYQQHDHPTQRGYTNPYDYVPTQ